MEFSREEDELLKDAMRLVEGAGFDLPYDRDDSIWFISSELKKRTTRRLLESKNPDLAEIGLYFLSFEYGRDSARAIDGESATSRFKGLSEFADKDISESNLKRFLSSEIRNDSLRSWTENAPEFTSLMRSALKSTFAAAEAPDDDGSVAANVSSMTIIVHGTFARSKKWWKNGGNFWKYIDRKISGLYGQSDAFYWSGADYHSDRVDGGKELKVWSDNHPADNLDVIAHSHGGNVALLASQNGLRIRKLINLGTPIRTEYLPNLGNIETLHNVFATKDYVQSPLGSLRNRRGEGRTLADSLQIINHRAIDDGRGHNPGHSDLHEPDTWDASGLDELLV